MWKENILKTWLFKDDDVTIITWFPCPSFPQTNPKWPVIVVFLNSSGAAWTEHIWWVFRIKPPFSNPYSSVVCVERALQSGKSKTKAGKLSSVHAFFKTIKHSKLKWVVTLWTKGLLAHCKERCPLFEIWRIRIRCIRFFSEAVANIASITRIYGNLQYFKMWTLEFFYKSRRPD